MSLTHNSLRYLAQLTEKSASKYKIVRTHAIVYLSFTLGRERLTLAYKN